MAKGVVYVMTSVIPGLLKIGKTETRGFEGRMRTLEANGYHNITGLKRFLAIELDNYSEKESLLHKIFNKHQVGNSELFALDKSLVRQLLLSFDGRVVYPEEEKHKLDHRPQPAAGHDASPLRQTPDKRQADKPPESFWRTTWRIRRGLTDAKGRYLDDRKGFVVLKGSVIDIRSTNSFNTRSDFRKVSRRRRDTLERYPDDGSGTITLKSDEFFQNVSSAAYFVNGNYQTPSKEWKSDSGETMYDLRRSY